MLIYEKWVEPKDEKETDPERELFGAENNIPSDDDTEVTYKDGEGQEVEDIDTYKYFYEKGGKLFASMSTQQVPNEAEDIEVSAWVGETCIAGDDDIDESAPKGGNGATRSIKGEVKAEPTEYTITYTKPRSVTVSPKSGSTFEPNSTVTLELVPDGERVFVETPSVFINEFPIQAIGDSKGYTATFEIKGDTAIRFVVHTTAITE